jgi:hypothetical protein
MPTDTPDLVLPALPALPTYPAEPGPARDEWHRLARLHTDAASVRAQQARADAEQAVAEAGQAAAAAQPALADPAYLAAMRLHAEALGKLAASMSRGSEISGGDAVIAAHVRGIARELADAPPASGAA